MIQSSFQILGWIRIRVKRIRIQNTDGPVEKNPRVASPDESGIIGGLGYLAQQEEAWDLQ